MGDVRSRLIQNKGELCRYAAMAMCPNMATSKSMKPTEPKRGYQLVWDHRIYSSSPVVKAVFQMSTLCEALLRVHSQQDVFNFYSRFTFAYTSNHRSLNRARQCLQTKRRLLVIWALNSILANHVLRYGVSCRRCILHTRDCFSAFVNRHCSVSKVQGIVIARTVQKRRAVND